MTSRPSSGRRAPKSEASSRIPRRKRIDDVLARPALRELMERAKHHFAVASGIDAVADPAAHQAAAFPGAIAIAAMVDAVLAEPRNSNLPESAVAHYVINLAYAELTAPIATEEQRLQHYLSVRLPAGRPPRQPSRARDRLVAEIRARPDMPDYLIKDHALVLEVWTQDQADDKANTRRRIRRLRNDAAK